MPIINATQLKSQLKNTLSAFYVVTGDEPLTCHEALDAIRLQARKQGVDERQVLIAERGFDWSSVIQQAQSTSLFSSQRLIELRIPNGKPGIEGSKTLQALAKIPLQDTTFIIQLPALDRDSKKSAWFKALEKIATIVQIQNIATNQLPQWIADRLALQQQTTSQETLYFLAQQVEGNLLAANQEILKLGLLYPQGELSDEAVKNAVLNVSRFDAFQLSEAVLKGDVQRTVHILNSLQDEGEKPIQVLYPLTWSIKPLTQLKLAYTRGESLDPILTRARVFGPKQGLMKKVVRGLSLKQIDRSLDKLAEIDQITKGVKQGDAWHEISRLCFGLATLCARRAKTI